jgi:hypothetical protein
MSVMKAFITKDDNFQLTWLSLMHPGEATFEEYLHVHQDFHDRTTYDHLWHWQEWQKKPSSYLILFYFILY